MSQLTAEMKRISRYMHRYKNERLAPLGISNRDGEIILFLTHSPEKGQDDIARTLFLNKSGVARHMTTMEERGLLVRKTNPEDRRELLLELTDKARALVPAIRKVNAQWSELITGGESPEEQELLLRLLTQMRENAAAYFREEAQI